MRIIPARQKDIRHIVRFNSQFGKKFRQHGYTIPIYEHATRIGITIRVEEGEMFVAANNGVAVGAICLLVDLYNPIEAYIESLAVSPRFHNNGYGKRLVQFAIRRSKNNNKRILTLETFCTLDVAQFYRNLGFRKKRKLGYNQGFPCYRFVMNLK